MSLTIPLACIKCASCGEPLTNAKSNKDGTLVCPECLTTTRLIIGMGGGGETTCTHGTGGNGKAVPLGG